MLSAALPLPCPGMCCSRAKRMMSQVIRKNSARLVFSITSSSRCSRAATARVIGAYLRCTASWQSR